MALMLILQSTQIMVRLDPQHGGEVIDLIDLASGRQWLGRPPFGSTSPVAGDLDEATWTDAYRGGWQMLAPNAGNRCVVDQVTHGFHGRASNDPWHVETHDDTSARLSWTGHGLKIFRHYRVVGDALRVDVHLEAIHDHVPLVAVEHIALGLQVLDPEVTIELPPTGNVVELDDAGKIPLSTQNASWPNARMLKGSIERVDQWSNATSCSRMLSVSDLAGGRVVIRNHKRKVGLIIEWDHQWLKHLWIWHEVHGAGGPWRQCAEMLIIEPASVPHHAGLAHAIERHDALWLDRGQTQQYQICVSPLAEN